MPFLVNGQLGPATFWDYFVWYSPNDKTFVLRWEPEDLQKVGVDEIEMTVTPSSGTGQPLHEKVNIATKLIRFTNILLSSGFEISMQALRNETRVIRHIVRLKTYKTGCPTDLLHCRLTMQQRMHQSPITRLHLKITCLL
ncbi:hypothetical protein EGR_05613 [Echinococcus granulosus]|uniref:Uncharacterized protein n=1 Tax=Echinococcus granulosus TaxID=6210 RepID=W6UFD3_ECHGR|nr:hypothetical protein EGR_05613 [Echinococcus granulosus]EUB59586.1 hypothetical protein EGR_05613 [Echinococcus granulosus]